MISHREEHEEYQAALAWVGRQVEAAERQGLTLDYLGGWHRFRPDKKALEHVWRVLYDKPDSMIHLLTPPAWQWEQVLLSWLRQHHERR
jgi:hypothetical protein